MTALATRRLSQLVALRRADDEATASLRRRVARSAATDRRRGFVPRVPVVTDYVEKVILQKDFLAVVGDHGAQSPGSVEVEVTRDADGAMRLWSNATGGGGGGGGNLQWAGSWGGTIPDGIFLSQYQGAWS